MSESDRQIYAMYLELFGEPEGTAVSTQATLPIPPKSDSRVCIEVTSAIGLLYIPDDLPNRERIIDGLPNVAGVAGIDPLFYFQKGLLQQMIYLMSNFPIRWGMPRDIKDEIL